MIRVGLHVKPLPPMREPEQIVIDALAAIKGDVDLQGSHVRGLVEFGHPNGQSRLCEAFAIMAHLAADRNFDALKAAFRVKRALDERAAAARKIELIMSAINGERDRVRAAGGVFTVSDIRPHHREGAVVMPLYRSRKALYAAIWREDVVPILLRLADLFIDRFVAALGWAAAAWVFVLLVRCST